MAAHFLDVSEIADEGLQLHAGLSVLYFREGEEPWVPLYVGPTPESCRRWWTKQGVHIWRNTGADRYGEPLVLSADEDPDEDPHQGELERWPGQAKPEDN